jgi:hypothetical protein
MYVIIKKFFRSLSSLIESNESSAKIHSLDTIKKVKNAIFFFINSRNFIFDSIK